MDQNSKLQLHIQALGDYYQPVSDDHPFNDLQEELRHHCAERFRRIDRFTQLSLVGSGRCVEHADVCRNTGLYLGSRFASINNANLLQERLLVKGEIPKPANFIHTLSNAAGYFVARNLRLSGRNLFVSREDASLVAALQLAQMDLSCGDVNRALVGIVDEMGIPTLHHCQRLGVAPGTPLAEASHWFLLGSNAGDGAMATLSCIQTLPAAAELSHWIEERMSESGALQWFATARTPDWVTDHFHKQLASARRESSQPQTSARFDPQLRYYPGILAGALIRYIDSGASADLLAIDGDSQGRYHVLRLRNTSSG